MRESSFYVAVNLAAGDRLPQILARLRALGNTYDDIVVALREDFAVVVSREWVRQQCIRLGIEDTGTAA